MDGKVTRKDFWFDFLICFNYKVYAAKHMNTTVLTGIKKNQNCVSSDFSLTLMCTLIRTQAGVLT